MNEPLDTVRFEYDNKTREVYIILDSAICRSRRSLIDSIVSHAESLLKARKESQEIYQYVIHSSTLTEVWNFLQGASNSLHIRVLIGTGIPRLKGLRIELTENSDSIRLFLPRSPKQLQQWRWQWIYWAIEMTLLQYKAILSPSKSEVQYRFEMALDGQVEKDGVTLLSESQQKAKESWNLKVHKAQDWVELQIFSKECLDDPNLVPQACSKSWDLLVKDLPDSFMVKTFHQSFLQRQIDELRRGPIGFGIGLPTSFLIAYRCAIVRDALPTTAFEKIFQQAKNSLKEDPRQERLFVCANLGLSKVVLQKLIRRLKRLLQKLSISRHDVDESARDYFCGVSVFPFTNHTTDHSANFQENLSQGPHSWLIWVIREMVKFSDFQLDVDWIASRLVIPVNRNQIEQALNWMLDKKMIVFDPDSKRTHQSIENIFTDPELTGEAISRHYQELFEMTPLVYAKAQADLKYIQFVRMRMTPSEFLRMREFISRFSQSILEMEKDAPIPEEIFQIGFLFFPVRTESPSLVASAS